MYREDVALDCIIEGDALVIFGFLLAPDLEASLNCQFNWAPASILRILLVVITSDGSSIVM